jgi:hypothetical protein
LRRWAELRPDIDRAARVCLDWRERFKRFDADNLVDPANAEDRADWLATYQPAAERALGVVQEYDALTKAIERQSREVAMIAERSGIDSAPLLLFAADLDERHWEAARAVVERVRARRAYASEEQGPPEVPLTPEDAAILTVLLRAKGVTMVVEAIAAKVTLSEKTIRTRLKHLRTLGLVEEPEKKKGHCLTAAGSARARRLPADAGRAFFGRAGTGR